MENRPISVRVTDLLPRIDRQRGDFKRASWIRAAIEEKLDRDEAAMARQGEVESDAQA